MRKRIAPIVITLALALASGPGVAEPRPSSLVADQNYADWVSQRTEQWEVELTRLQSRVPLDYRSTHREASIELRRLQQDLRKKRAFGLSSELRESLVGRVYQLESKLERLSSQSSPTELILTKNSGE